MKNEIKSESGKPDSLTKRETVKILFIFVRAVTYAALFISFVLVFLPVQILSWSGVVKPQITGTWQWIGMFGVFAGTILALWCVLVFIFVGKGTPAPFDAPRRLVVRGPYKYVRNPMYIGASLALASAGLFFESFALSLFTIVFLLITHFFVIIYEEHVLRKKFGDEYDTYCRRVRRWWPKLTTDNQMNY